MHPPVAGADRVSIPPAGSGEVHYVGPPTDRVRGLMADLPALAGGTPEHPLTARSVFHTAG